jgi:UPF0716 protein FxsA
LRYLPLFLIAWPLLEIAAFVLVGREIGVFATIGLTILTAIAGSMLLRIQGFGVLRRAQAEVDAGRDPGREMANGAMIIVAGLLLLLPGFVSDVIGLALFIPPVRDAVWRMLKTRIRIVTDFGPGMRRRDPRTIDLDPDEYSSGSAAGKPDPSSPWRHIGHDDKPGSR